MTDILHRILLSALLVVGMSACSDHADGPVPEPGGETESEPAMVGFYIQLDSETGDDVSRATPEGDYHPGFSFEKYINISGGDIKFLFFGEDNKLQAEFTPNGIVSDPGDSLNHSKRYHVLGTLPFDIRKTPQVKTKIMVLANWRTRTGKEYAFEPGMTIDQVVSADWGIFEFDESKIIPDRSNPIPFFGITDLVTLTRDSFTKDTNFTYTFGTIHLLRALAKVELMVSKDTDWVIEEASIENYSNTGYSAPEGVYEKKDYVHNSYDEDYTSKPYCPYGSLTKETVKFKKVSDNRFIAYIPEFKNVLYTDQPYVNRSKIYVKIKDIARRQIVEFRDYKVDDIDKGYFDIMRNYWYKFTLNKSEIRPTIEVRPWKLREHPNIIM